MRKTTYIRAIALALAVIFILDCHCTPTEGHVSRQRRDHVARCDFAAAKGSPFSHLPQATFSACSGITWRGVSKSHLAGMKTEAAMGESLKLVTSHERRVTVFFLAPKSDKKTFEEMKNIADELAVDQRVGEPADIRFCVERVAEYLNQIPDEPGQKIVIVHHTDADGIAAAALMREILQAFKQNIRVEFVGALLADKTLLDKTADATHIVVLDSYFPRAGDQAVIEALAKKPMLFIDHHDSQVVRKSREELREIAASPRKDKLNVETPEELGMIYISPKRLGSSLAENSSKYNAGWIVRQLGERLAGPGFVQSAEWKAVISCYGDMSDDVWMDKLAPYSQDTMLKLGKMLDSVEMMPEVDAGSIAQMLAQAKTPQAFEDSLKRDPQLSQVKICYEEKVVPAAAAIAQAARSEPADAFLTHCLTPEDQMFNGRMYRPARTISNELYMTGGALHNSGEVIFILQEALRDGKPAVSVECSSYYGLPPMNKIMKELFDGGGHAAAAGATVPVEEGKTVAQTMQEMVQKIRAWEDHNKDIIRSRDLGTSVDALVVVGEAA